MRMRLAPGALFTALPDALTCATFLVAWIAPALLPDPLWVKDLMLVMLIEFIVMHSSGFYAALAAGDAGRAKKIAALCGLSAMYLVFIVAFAMIFDSNWPLFAFGWLFASRFLQLLLRPLQTKADARALMGQWAASGVTYIVGAIATVMLPLPRFGITPEFVATLHLPGKGEWIERPYTVLAFGVMYFAVQAWVKYAGARPAAPATALNRSGAGVGR
jgi:hypothetical protein